MADFQNSRDHRMPELKELTRGCMMFRLCVALLCCSSPSFLLAATKPNIVLIIADDCTFRDLGCYGGQAFTPHIDKLATEGMRFTRCFQAAPMCSPTRHHIYTGQYPVKTGAYPNHTHLNPGIQTVVQYLKPLGYRVAHSGKGHVGPNSVFAWEHLPGNQNPDFSKVNQFVAECQKNSEPFCLFLCSNEPHSPWNLGDASRYPPEKIQLPPDFVETPETRESMSHYLAEITYFDDQVGQAVKMLDRQGLAEETLLIVVSEQGSSFPFAKWTCYDSGLQSACIARWPGKIQAGKENPAMIEYVDLLPTFVDVAGGTPASEMDGKSLRDVLAGKEQHKKYVFGEMTTRGIINGSDYFGIRSVRSEQFKYIWNFTPEVTFQNACSNSPEFKSWEAKAAAGDLDAREKVNRYLHRPEIELYNILTDPLELHNLAHDRQYDDVKRELRLQLDQWMQHCGDRGQATELQAFDHMGAGRKSKRE